MDNPTIGYHAIRGLAGPLRMMCYYKGQRFTNKAYGSDMQDTWHKGEKTELVKLNSCMNLPYIKNGDELVTQSNTCALYLGKKLGIDTEDCFFHNHCVLDQTMDWRNDLMKIVYPFFGVVKDKEGFPEAAKSHLSGTTATNLTKLEGFCKGPYMCGDKIQSGDFMLFEMLDQHASIAESVGAGALLDSYPKMKALHAKMKSDPALKGYFESEFYAKYPQNNGIYTLYTGMGPDFVYSKTAETAVTP